MTINTTTKSFTSLNGAIKVTKLDYTNSSSSKKLDNAVSVNISSNATSNTTSLLSSSKEETVIQSRNIYVNKEALRREKLVEDHYESVNIENLTFPNPSAHIYEKYMAPESSYFIEDLTYYERKLAYENEMSYLDNGKVSSNSPLDRVLRGMTSVYGEVESIDQKLFDRQSVNKQFQSLMDKYNISIPKDTKFSFTIDPNTLKATVSGSDNETLNKSVQDVINTADNIRQLFYHIISSRSDDSTQYNDASDTKFNLTQNIKDTTGYTLKDLEIKDGKFITPDGTDVAEIYTKKINENPNMSDFYKRMEIGSIVGELKKLAKNGFDSVPNLVLSIDYQNNSFYDVKQSKNFGDGQTEWIEEWKKSVPLLNGGDDVNESTKGWVNYLRICGGEEEAKKYLNEQIQKSFGITLNFDKNKKIKEVAKHILTKDELMIMYLLGKSEKEKKEMKKFSLAIEKLKEMNKQLEVNKNKLNSEELYSH